MLSSGIVIYKKNLLKRHLHNIKLLLQQLTHESYVITLYSFMIFKESKIFRFRVVLNTCVPYDNVVEWDIFFKKQKDKI